MIGYTSNNARFRDRGGSKAVADVVDDAGVVEALTRDPDDDVVALAHEHAADVIVSGDKDLLEWKEQRPTVVTSAAFEEMIGPA